MNEQQQKLYDKLLKKVNEYCLGAAAEDVIAAIDELVTSYENKITVIFGSRANGKTIMLFNAYEEYKAFEIIKKYPFVVRFIQTKQSYSDLAITMPNTEIPTKEEYELLKEVLK